jgi:hypothetical protein
MKGDATELPQIWWKTVGAGVGKFVTGARVGADVVGAAESGFDTSDVAISNTCKPS